MICSPLPPSEIVEISSAAGMVKAQVRLRPPAFISLKIDPTIAGDTDLLEGYMVDLFGRFLEAMQSHTIQSLRDMVDKKIHRSRGGLKAAVVNVDELQSMEGVEKHLSAFFPGMQLVGQPLRDEPPTT